MIALARWLPETVEARGLLSPALPTTPGDQRKPGFPGRRFVTPILFNAVINNPSIFACRGGHGKSHGRCMGGKLRRRTGVSCKRSLAAGGLPIFAGVGAQIGLLVNGYSFATAGTDGDYGELFPCGGKFSTERSRW